MKRVSLLLLLLANFAAAKIVPADGFWRTTDDPAIGSGLLVTTQGNVTLVSVFTYDEQGQNSWYVATAEVGENGLFEADLYQTKNGSNIVSLNPHSAETINTGQRLSIRFSGNQLGELAIGGSAYKSIQAFHFGVENWQTQHLNLPDGTFYYLPVLDGQWVVGSKDTGQVLIFDLVYDPVLSNDISTPPYQDKVYVSEHPSTRDWMVSCPWTVLEQTRPILIPYCTVYTADLDSEAFKINYTELGSQKMLLRSTEDQSIVSEAFKLKDTFMAHNGHWRTSDDPDVGSGLYLLSQGSTTLAVLYSYQDEGKAQWSIASGNIDSTGLFQAELLTPSGGKPMYLGSQEAASVLSETQMLTLEFAGAELGTISIDGSPAKNIQHYNYGSELFETEQLRVDDSNYMFPDQAGYWVVTDNRGEMLDVVELMAYSPNCCISPTVPWYEGARAYSVVVDSETSPGDFGLDFICTVTTERFGYEEVLVPYCTGWFGLFQTAFYRDLKVYFEDIGVDGFRAYLGEGAENDFDDIDRESDYLTFYRLR